MNEFIDPELFNIPQPPQYTMLDIAGVDPETFAGDHLTYTSTFTTVRRGDRDDDN